MVLIIHLVILMTKKRVISKAIDNRYGCGQLLKPLKLFMMLSFPLYFDHWQRFKKLASAETASLNRMSLLIFH